MKKVIIVMVIFAYILLLGFVPVWATKRPWTGEKEYMGTWSYVKYLYYKDKVVY